VVAGQPVGEPIDLCAVFAHDLLPAGRGPLLRSRGIERGGPHTLTLATVTHTSGQQGLNAF
jgi:hypothetical protein